METTRYGGGRENAALKLGGRAKVGEESAPASATVRRAEKEALRAVYHLYRFFYAR